MAPEFIAIFSELLFVDSYSSAVNSSVKPNQSSFNASRVLSVFKRFFKHI